MVSHSSLSLFDKSVLVVAHPDDEILWCSSILKRVQKIVICYLSVPSDQGLTEARKEVLKEYPLDNVACLGIGESGSFNKAKWEDPQTTDYGIKLTKRGSPIERYRTNFFHIVDALKDELKGAQNVFTHNPWGEYGNEEHIQVYRAVCEVRKRIGYSVRFTNYCSDRSAKLMSSISNSSGISPNYIELETDRTLYSYIRDIYLRNSGWTWYEDWQCFSREAWLEKANGGERPRLAFVWPLNMIQLKAKCSDDKQRGFIRRIKGAGIRKVIPFFAR